jgi:hypothetical protein
VSVPPAHPRARPRATHRHVARVYAAHRRAYVPRIWPLVLIDGATIYVFVALLRPSLLLTIVIAVVVGPSVVAVRFWIWRRRHPVISAEQYAADWAEAMRRAARWN